MRVKRENIFLKRHGRTAILTITNPPANRWTSESLVVLKQLVKTMNEDSEIHSLIVIGQGQKYFSAGVDPKISTGQGLRIAHDVARVSGEAFEALFDFDGPSIAVINGYAFNTGLECALACDMRIAEEHVRMGFSDDESAAVASGYSAPWLSWIVGEVWAQHMGLCGGQMYARTALRLGLVDQVVPRGMGLSTAMKLVKTFEEKGLTNVRAYKPVLKDARRAIDQRDLDVQGRMS